MHFPSAYANSVNNSNLKDDDLHHNCVPLAASGWAGRDMSELGALLMRAKMADGTPSKLFETGCRNLGPILRLWVPLVREKGKARKWRRENTDRDISTAEALYKRVADSSLAYWMDDRCNECQGATVDSDRRTCQRCHGSGKEELLMAPNEKDITLDLVSELEDILQSHSRRAAPLVRDEVEA